MKIRIQKYLSQQGLLSRRKAEHYILKGWILVNGEVITELGTHIDPDTDTISFDPNLTHIMATYRYIAFYKPRGVITNCPVDDTPEIKDLLPDHLKSLSTIGRLDKDSQGLILLSDDGVFAKRCLSVDRPHERVYHVWIHCPLTDSQHRLLESGILLDGYLTRPLKITTIGDNIVEICMIEGKNRQIRRMFQYFDIVVRRLKRVSFGPITLGTLNEGEFRLLPEAPSLF